MGKKVRSMDLVHLSGGLLVKKPILILVVQMEHFTEGLFYNEMKKKKKIISS